MIKNKYLLYFLLVLIIISILLLKFRFLKTDPSSIKIEPNQTTKNQLEAKLGQPQQVTESSSSTVYDYPSSYGSYPTQYVLNENVVSFIREPIEESQAQTLQEYQQIHGSEEATKYLPSMGPNFLGYLYPSQGQAVFINEQSQKIMEIWSFPKTNLKTFLSTWGKQLTDSFAFPKD